LDMEQPNVNIDEIVNDFLEKVEWAFSRVEI
jgi:hypothetical protein